MTKQDRKQKNTERIDERNLSNLIFWSSSSHEQKRTRQEKNKKMEAIKKGPNKEGREGKKKERKKEKKNRELERERERVRRGSE